MAIGHEELHEMTKRAVLTVPMLDLQKPHPMTIEGGIFLADPPVPTPRPSPARSDSLSPLSSYSATPPSIPGEERSEEDTITHDPRKQAAITRQTQTTPDPSGADGPLQPQCVVPKRSILRPAVLGRGTPLWPTAPLTVPGLKTAPLLETTVIAVPLSEMTIAAAPLLETTVAAVPLPETTTTAAPLPEMTVAAVPLPEE